MKRWGLFVFMVTMLIAVPAVAQEKSGSCLGNLYVGVGVQYAGFVGNDMKDYDPSFGMNLKVGRLFESLALEFQLRHTNSHKNDVGAPRGELNGFVVDLKWFLSASEKQRLYALTGIGHYWFAFDNSDDSIKGVGFNLGGGLEHFLEERVSVTTDLVYTILKFTRYDDGNTTSDLDPSISGDAVTASVALNLYF